MSGEYVDVARSLTATTDSGTEVLNKYSGSRLGWRWHDIVGQSRRDSERKRGKKGRKRRWRQRDG
jgi:hypothetical protein